MPALTSWGHLRLKRIKRIKDPPVFSCAAVNIYQTHLDISMVLKCWRPHRQTTPSQPSRYFLSWKKSQYFGSLWSFYGHTKCFRQRPRAAALLGTGPALRWDWGIPPWTEDVSRRPGIPRPHQAPTLIWQPFWWGLCPCACRHCPCCSLCLPALLGRAWQPPSRYRGAYRDAPPSYGGLTWRGWGGRTCWFGNWHQMIYGEAMDNFMAYLCFCWCRNLSFSMCSYFVAITFFPRVFFLRNYTRTTWKSFSILTFLF